MKSGVLVKQSNIGVAVASNWFMGGRPRISSIVRRRLVVLYCVLTTCAALRVGAGDVGRGAVAAHVVPAVLRVVLDGEDRHLPPEGRVAEGLDDPAEGEVVVGHGRRGRGGAGLVPLVWSLGRQMMVSCGNSPRAVNPASSLMMKSARNWSGTAISHPTYAVGENGRMVSIIGSLAKTASSLSPFQVR